MTTARVRPSRQNRAVGQSGGDIAGGQSWKGFRYQRENAFGFHNDVDDDNDHDSFQEHKAEGMHGPQHIRRLGIADKTSSVDRLLLKSAFIFLIRESDNYKCEAEMPGFLFLACHRRLCRSNPCPPMHVVVAIPSKLYISIGKVEIIVHRHIGQAFALVPSRAPSAGS